MSGLNSDEIAMLRELWSLPISCREIGRRMGRSKNSIIGHAHRLDLPRRGKPQAKKKASSARMAKKVYTKMGRALYKPLSPKKILATIDSNGVTFNELARHHCRSILDKRDGSRHNLPMYCGKTVQPGSSFCADHHRVYYVKSTWR